MYFFQFASLFFAYTSSFLTPTDRCYRHLFSAVFISRIFSDAQDVTASLGGLRRSSSIAASLTVLSALL
jgi:hypothetical protein